MSDNNKLPAVPSTPLVPSAARVEGGPQSRSESQPGNHDLAAELKRYLDESRLPIGIREQILANLPPPEERERLFRELQEKGGLPSEQFLVSLGLESEPQP